MDNKLILRSQNSPYGDITKGSVLSHADVDNNFINLKGELITTGQTFGNTVILTKINGGTINFNVPGGGGSDTYWTSGSTGLFSIKALNDSGLDATSDYAVAEGYNTLASGVASHAEGEATTAFGASSHAEGTSTTANGFYSHAEGIATRTYGEGAHAEGQYTYAGVRTFIVESVVNGVITLNASYGDVTSSFTYGQVIINSGLFYYNTITFSSGTNTEIILNDTTVNTGSWVVDTNNYDDPLADNIIGTFTHSEGFNTVALSQSAHAEGRETFAIGPQSHAEGYTTTASGSRSHAEGQGTKASGQASHAEGVLTTASDFAAHAEGNGTIASSGNAHAEGNQSIASGFDSHAEGYLTVASGASSHSEGNQTQAIGDSSHAEGQNTKSYGQYSHAEGVSTSATTYATHAEGDSTIASGLGSHAEGGASTASGVYSHAEGEQTTAAGNRSHSEGYSTIANGQFSHAEGQESTVDGIASHVGGYLNNNHSNYSFIGGGSGNTIYINSTFSSIVGGADNQIQNAPSISDSKYSFIGGGNGNIISSHNQYSSILGGKNNIISTSGSPAGGSYSNIIGGHDNILFGSGNGDIIGSTIIGSNLSSISADTDPSRYSVIIGGWGHSINNHSDGTALIGGSYNLIIGGDNFDTAAYSAIIGGQHNIIYGPSEYNGVQNSIILGGSYITATTSNTVYVPKLNIGTLSTGTSVYNLGIDANGYVVTGSTGSSIAKYAETTALTANVVYTVTHNLGLDISVDVKDLTLNEKINVFVNNYTPTTVDITSTSNVASARIIIIG